MILATGADGIVGGYLAQAYPQGDLVLTGRAELDVCDRDQVEAAFARHSPHQVLHLAAMTDVDRCELEPDEAYRTNVLGALNVALACQKYGAEMVYVSTIMVLGGVERARPYTEFDEPSPVSVYARSKLEGERVVQQLLPRCYVVRTCWLMGGGPGVDHKFVGKFVELIRTRDELSVVDDKFGSPTYARHLAANLRLLTDSGLYGVYHCVNGGSCSRYEMAVEIARLLGREVSIQRVPSAHFPQPAPRPRSEAARNYKLELLGLNRMPPWREALTEYVGTWGNASSQLSGARGGAT